jgi:hypothetical protein
MEIGVLLRIIHNHCFLSDLKSHKENIRTSALISCQAVTPGSRQNQVVASMVYSYLIQKRTAVFVGLEL